MYLRENFAPQRERYQAYIAQMLQLAGWDKPQENAKAILALETRIAEAHWTRAESRNRDKTYNPLALADFATTSPGFPWAAFFTAAGVEGADRAVIRQDSAIPKIAAIFADTDVATHQAWQAFHATDNAAPLLSKDFSVAQYEFRDKFLSGQPQQRERWKRGVAFAESAMGEAIGRDYVKLYFPPEAKAKMDALVANVKAAMGARLDTLAWMSPATKAEAHAKLAGFGLKIGHPDTYRDYSALVVKNGDLFGNAQRAGQFEWDYRRKRVGQPVDKGEWGMTPQTVNAYYNSVKNEIVFPAAILQPPFFDGAADDAVNYGAIGAVILPMDVRWTREEKRRILAHFGAHHVLVPPGETVPADGVVVHGRSSCSQAWLTGESTPVDKTSGAPILAGSINLDQPLVVEVTRIGA